MSSAEATLAPTAGRRAMAFFAGLSLAAILAGSAAPTPIYRLYQETWALSPLTLTLIFSIYAITLLLSLLTVGSLSDYVGRRPVISAGLFLSAVAMVLFIEADSAGWLIAARAVQGIATGALTSTLGATILDSNREKGAMLNSLMPFFGMAAGALGSSTLVTFAPAPLQLVYIVMLILFVALASVVWQMPETASPTRGAWASLKPHIAVPVQARRPLLLISPVNIAAWALGSFYLSLMPSLFRVATGLTSPLLGGSVVAALTLSGAAAVLLARTWPARRTLLVGTATLIPGVAVTLSGVYFEAAPLLLVGTILAGLGMGSSFFGASRKVMPLAELHERAGLLAAFYVESYLAFSLPVILIGIAAPHFGLPVASYLYGGALIVLAAMSLLATLFTRKN
jgi:MFS family permease